MVGALPDRRGDQSVRDLLVLLGCFAPFVAFLVVAFVRNERREADQLWDRVAALEAAHGASLGRELSMPPARDQTVCWRPPEGASGSRRTVARAAVLVGLVASVGGLAMTLRWLTGLWWSGWFFGGVATVLAVVAWWSR